MSEGARFTGLLVLLVHFLDMTFAPSVSVALDLEALSSERTVRGQNFNTTSIYQYIYKKKR